MVAAGRIPSTLPYLGNVPLKNIASLLWYQVHHKQRYSFYRYAEQQPDADDSVSEYKSWGDIPIDFRDGAMPPPWILIHRQRLGQARLLCLADPEAKLQAWGWIQSWKPFSRKFSMIADDAVMLGPYWTAPEHRGKGLYGRLLKHSVHLCQNGKAILIATPPDNLASQKAITKAGFVFCGEWEVSLWFRIFVRRRLVRS